MIRSGVDALRGIGIPSDRIRHDSLEELVAARRLAARGSPSSAQVGGVHRPYALDVAVQVVPQ